MHSGEASGYLPYTVYMVSAPFADKNPAAAEAFTRAIYRGQQWVNSHSAAEIAEVILPQFPESDAETLTTIINRYQAQDTWKTDPTVDPEGFTLIQDIMEQGGELDTRVAYEDIIRTDFADAVIK